jgi:hypothetical protein
VACFYDQTASDRLGAFVNAFLNKFRGRVPGVPGSVNFWTRRAVAPDAPCFWLGSSFLVTGSVWSDITEIQLDRSVVQFKVC